MQDTVGGREQAEEWAMIERTIWLIDSLFVLKGRQPLHSPSQVSKQSENHTLVILLSISVALGFV